jgi:hypothetical protein
LAERDGARHDPSTMMRDELRSVLGWRSWAVWGLIGASLSCSAAPQLDASPSNTESTRSVAAAAEGADPEMSTPAVVRIALAPQPARGAKTDPTASKPSGAAEYAPTGPRIAAIGLHTWIMPEPRHEGLALGNVRLDTSVALAEPEPVGRHGCGGGWYAVVPRGFVCNDPKRTTLDLDDPYVRALREVAPDLDAIFPYRYAYSRGAPMYSRVPTPEEWRQAEAWLGPVGRYQQLGDWAKGHEELLEPERAIEASDEVPWFFEGGTRHIGDPTRSARVLVWRTIPNGSMLSYARSFEMHGRVWLVTPDLMLVPADRVQAMRRSTFHGVKLDANTRLPLGWNRRLEPQPLYRRDASGRFVASDEHIEPKGWRMIVDEPIRAGGDDYYPLLARSDRYLAGKHTSITRQRETLPRAIKPGEKWIDARITPGTLTAYVGLDPVYATLFSPGKGGHPVAGNDHTKFATTQIGYFRFEWKERVATMSNEKGEPKLLWFSDVPHVQYVKAPLAMHVAYWHEDFSIPKSAECVNLSPRDGRWLFGFTDPPLPEGWGAVRPGGGNGLSTPIMINGM